MLTSGDAVDNNDNDDDLVDARGDVDDVCGHVDDGC